MTYDQLIAFLAVAGEGSFSAASARLHKSQPAVSKLVRNLESELGVELFDRREYRATLTDAGRLFHERASVVVEGTEALRSFGMQLSGKVEPIVRLAVDAVTPLGPIMDVFRGVQARYASVRLELGTERLAGAADALRERRADLAVATRLGIDPSEVETARFCDVRVLPVARFDHPVATCGTPIPPALLRAHAQIVLRDSARGGASPSLNVLEGGLRWTVTDVAAKKEVILAGMGWGGLPEHVAADALASGELVTLQVPEFEADVMELFVTRRRDRPHGVVAQALWEALRRGGRDAGAPTAAGKARRRRRKG
ncbi:LysR family transcriptional regulator [Sorangium cellulosum]|uniref:LysR family transcriptional regulator n=1 Tax=Sorangium cellulosum TaxID=56 RepID=A0A4P2QDR9_SORCE|nr:LysR family transcriptional regulator [Sorangium cellulosum]AUX27536.1 LysR family transcriptional regulator [Sorangium cellulosum]